MFVSRFQMVRKSLIGQRCSCHRRPFCCYCHRNHLVRLVVVVVAVAAEAVAVAEAEAEMLQLESD